MFHDHMGRSSVDRIAPAVVGASRASRDLRRGHRACAVH